MDLGGLGAHWWWLLGAALLGILEIFAPGVFLVWLAAAAAATGIVVALLPLGLPIQLVLFSMLAAVAVIGGRRYYEHKASLADDLHINDPVARLIGQEFEVVTEIRGGQGRVRIGDSVWTARGADTPAGARVRVTGVKGNCLDVVPVPALPPADGGA
ncbi:MAG: NfeD family protein [Sphingomonas sp.]|nr:NfeD family protein [Sphingomonas sp.]